MQQQLEARRSASWAAILLPLLAVGGALGSFASDGLLTRSTGHAPVLTYVLPLVISPVVAALFAVLASLVRRGRYYWLTVGYLLVLGSLVAGLLAANASKGGGL
jgi:hypothetical protein